MKLSLAALAVGALTLSGQDYPGGQLKHLMVPTTTSVGPVSIAALEIERGGQYPSMLHLKGRVEIKTPVCLVAGPNDTQYCGGYVVLHADEADFHEDSGQVEAHGNVTVTREK